MTDSAGAVSAAPTADAFAVGGGGLDRGSLSSPCFDRMLGSAGPVGAPGLRSPDAFGLSGNLPSRSGPLDFSGATPGAFARLSSGFGPTIDKTNPGFHLASLPASQEFSASDIDPVTNNTLADLTPLGQVVSEITRRGQLLTGAVVGSAQQTVAEVAHGPGEQRVAEQAAQNQALDTVAEARRDFEFEITLNSEPGSSYARSYKRALAILAADQRLSEATRTAERGR